MDTTPFWNESVSLPRFGSLDHDLDVDVLVVGGGLTGITAARLFQREGCKVALIERGRCADADTGHTTAHLTYVTDTRLRDLCQNFGRDSARAAWEGGAAAIDHIAGIVRADRVECEFKWVPGYLHASLDGGNAQDAEHLKEEARIAQELGFEAEFLNETPFFGGPAIRFASQAKFHPRKYLRGLLLNLAEARAMIYENTEAEKVEDDPLRVHANGRTIRCRFLVIATHTPLMGNTGMLSAIFLQSKLALYTSYALGARIPSGLAPEALFWDTSAPYYYSRFDRQGGHDYLVFGGEDCKTGQEDEPGKVFLKLEDRLKKLIPKAEIDRRWCGQVVESNDGLPFVGETAPHQFVMTGFCGNGFTFGTLAALMAVDRFMGRPNPWTTLFDVRRKRFHGGLWRYLKENKDYPYYMLRDRLAGAETSSLDEVRSGQGALANIGGKKAAVYRSPEGKLSVLSPVCPHLGCIVRWNAADKTWDCPCHGSRFKPEGEVFSGPAEKPLPPLEQS